MMNELDMEKEAIRRMMASHDSQMAGTIPAVAKQRAAVLPPLSQLVKDRGITDPALQRGPLNSLKANNQGEAGPLSERDKKVKEYLLRGQF